MIYGYVSVLHNRPGDITKMILRYADQNCILLKTVYEDRQSNAISWRKRELNELVSEVTHPGDAIVIYEASNIGRTKSAFLDFMQVLIERNITLHMVKYNKLILPNLRVNGDEFVELIHMIDSDFIAKEMTTRLMASSSRRQ